MSPAGCGRGSGRPAWSRSIRSRTISTKPIDLIFAPPEQIPELADLVDEAAESDTEIPDPPEPIVNGVIDLGRLATDALFLAVDPYPRKPDAVFEPLIEAADPEDHPFAALKSAAAQRPNRAAQSSKPEKPRRRQP